MQANAGRLQAMELSLLHGPKYQDPGFNYILLFLINFLP
jgi:hypothetical protein